MDYTKTKEQYLMEIEDICILKGFSKEAIKAYKYHIGRFLQFIDKSSLNLNQGCVKCYLLSLNLAPNSMRLSYASIRFFFSEILKQPFTPDEVPIKKRSSFSILYIMFSISLNDMTPVTTSECIINGVSMYM